MDHGSKDGRAGAGDKLWIGETEVWNVHLSDINHNLNIYKNLFINTSE